MEPKQAKKWEIVCLKTTELFIGYPRPENTPVFINSVPPGTNPLPRWKRSFTYFIVWSVHRLLKRWLGFKQPPLFNQFFASTSAKSTEYVPPPHKTATVSIHNWIILSTKIYWSRQGSPKIKPIGSYGRFQRKRKFPQFTRQKNRSYIKNAACNKTQNLSYTIYGKLLLITIQYTPPHFDYPVMRNDKN